MPNSIALTATLLTALFASIPRVSQPQRGRIEQRHDAIVAMATDSAERFNVPVVLLMVTGFLETHLGTDDGEHGNWGSPIDRRHRHTAGTSDSAARDLAHSFQICGNWLAAVRRYRTGLCFRDASVGYTAAYSIRLAERVYHRAGIDLPEHWR